MARYQLTSQQTLPKELQEELPTAEELSNRFPLMSMVKLRIEIEKALNALAKEHDLPSPRRGVSQLVRELDTKGLVPPSARNLIGVMNAMHEAAHGIDVESERAQEAIRIGTQLLSELRTYNQASADES